MKKLLVKIVLLLLIAQNSFGQFTDFYKSAGLILSKGAAITHVATAGGGVVLKGVASPRHSDSLSMFLNVTFDEANGLSTMHIQTQESNISFSDSTWLMRDAAMLVKSESEDTLMYRNIHLFGEFTSDDYEKGYDTLYPIYEYFNIEMVESLRNTKSGQALLYMDIILAGDAITEYYCSNNETYIKYSATSDSLSKIIENYNYSIYNLPYKEINDLYLKLRNFDSNRQSENFDSSEIALFNKIKQYSVYYLFQNKLWEEFAYYDSIPNYSNEIDSLFNIDYFGSAELMNHWNDYTYNDENTNYTFYITKKDNRLYIEGEPYYTFLYHNYSYFEDEIVIDSLFTNYFIRHPDLIKNLNFTVYTYAEHFGRIAAFYRYLESEYPKFWMQVYKHYSEIKKSEGVTPRFIDRYPSDEN